ncbi:MAG TPA: hypothetical protein VF510_08320 [Ktedonobacterales bacterium]
MLWFDTLIWDDTLRQHKDVALEACTVGFQAVYQAYLDAWQVDINLGILAVMLLALAALFTILRGVVAKLWPQK